MVNNGSDPLQTFTIQVDPEVFTAVVMKVAIFWDRAQYSPYMNQQFGETYHLHLQGKKSV
jgi:hypothetical protein